MVTGSVEKRLLHHIIFISIVWYMEDIKYESYHRLVSLSLFFRLWKPLATNGSEKLTAGKPFWCPLRISQLKPCPPIPGTFWGSNGGVVVENVVNKVFSRGYTGQ